MIQSLTQWKNISKNKPVVYTKRAILMSICLRPNNIATITKEYVTHTSQAIYKIYQKRGHHCPTHYDCRYRLQS
jgi:hypothetical protein